MYGGLRAANTEIMNDMFRREQADRAQQNADREFNARQEQYDRAQQNADREFGFKQSESERLQGNADRTFQLETEKAQADIDFKNKKMQWEEELHKRNIQEADLRIEAAKRIADKDRAKAEADKQSADGFLYSASKILLGGGGERFSFCNGEDGKPIYAMDVPIAGTNNKIKIDDAFKLSSAQVESLRASGIPILGNVQNIIMHTNNDTGKKEFLIVNEDNSVSPISEDQMYNASKSFGGQSEADAIFGRSNETRQREKFDYEEGVKHKYKMEELQTTRAVSAYTSFIKSMKDMGYDVEEINKMWDSPTNPIKKMLMGGGEKDAEGGSEVKVQYKEGQTFKAGDTIQTPKGPMVVPQGSSYVWQNGRPVPVKENKQVQPPPTKTPPPPPTKTPPPPSTTPPPKKEGVPFIGKKSEVLQKERDSKSANELYGEEQVKKIKQIDSNATEETIKRGDYDLAMAKGRAVSFEASPAGQYKKAIAKAKRDEDIAAENAARAKRYLSDRKTMEDKMDGLYRSAVKNAEDKAKLDLRNGDISADEFEERTERYFLDDVEEINKAHGFRAYKGRPFKGNYRQQMYDRYGYDIGKRRGLANDFENLKRKSK